MQSLKVSGAGRLLQGSLGVKGLKHTVHIQPYFTRKEADVKSSKRTDVIGNRCVNEMRVTKTLETKPFIPVNVDITSLTSKDTVSVLS